MRSPQIRLLIMVLFILLSLALLGACGTSASPGNGTPGTAPTQSSGY